MHNVIHVDTLSTTHSFPMNAWEVTSNALLARCTSHPRRSGHFAPSSSQSSLSRWSAQNAHSQSEAAACPGRIWLFSLGSTDTVMMLGPLRLSVQYCTFRIMISIRVSSIARCITRSPKAGGFNTQRRRQLQFLFRATGTTPASEGSKSVVFGKGLAFAPRPMCMEIFISVARLWHLLPPTLTFCASWVLNLHE